MDFVRFECIDEWGGQRLLICLIKVSMQLTGPSEPLVYLSFSMGISAAHVQTALFQQLSLPVNNAPAFSEHLFFEALIALYHFLPILIILVCQVRRR